MNNIPIAYWSFLTLFLVLGTAILAYRLKSDSIFDGLQKISGYFTTWVGLVTGVLFILPILLRLIPIYMASMWQPVLSQYSADGRDVAQSASAVFASSFSNIKTSTFYSNDSVDVANTSSNSDSASATQGDTYVVRNGDTFNEIADELGIDRAELANFNRSNIPNPALLEPGDEIRIPSSNEPTPTPTIAITLTNPIESQSIDAEGTPLPPTPLPSPTPSPTPNYQTEIVEVIQLRTYGHLTSASQIISDVLSKNPSHQEALQIQEEMNRARATIAQWNSLGSAPKENHELVKSYLNGYSFEIVDKEDKYLASLWKETITLRSVTNGWAYGIQFSLPRGHVYHILNGHDPVGLTFEVE